MKRIELVKIGSWIFRNKDNDSFGKLAAVVVGYAWVVITDYTKLNFDADKELDIDAIWCESPDVLEVIRLVESRMIGEAIRMEMLAKKESLAQRGKPVKRK